PLALPLLTKGKTKCKNQQQTKRHMTNFLKLAGVATMAIVLTQSLQANQISGNIGFTGLVEYNTTSAGTASDVVGWANTQVLGTSGSFTTIANGTAASFTSATWALATSSTI